MGGAASLIAVVYSLQQMLKMIQTVSDMPLKTMLKGLGMLGGIMLALEWVVTGVGKAGANADKAGKSLLMISAALYIMVEVIRNIDDLNSSALTKGIATIGLMSMFFAVLIAVTKNAGANSVKAGVGILAMSGAVAVLAGAMYVIGKIPASELTKSIAVITSIFTMFGFLMALSSKATGSYKAIIAISASMAALIALMAVMSTMDTDSLTRSTVALDSIMAMLALTIAATKGVDGGSLAAIAMITLAVAAIGFVLYQLASLPNPEDVLPIAVSMSSVLLALSAAMAIMGNMGVVGIATGSLGIIAAIATITAVLEALGGLMKLDIFSENLDNAITAMGKIGEALGTFIGGIGTGLTGQLPKMAKNISDFADGMQEFVEFVHNLDDNFGSKVDTLVKATEKLTRRGFTSGLNNLSASGINYETIGTNLKNLGEAIKGMAAATSGVSVERLTSSAEAVSAIADIMANVPVSGGLWGDIVGNTMNLSDLGSQLTSFAQAMVNYCSIINGAEGGAALDTAAVEQSKAAADILIDLAGKAPNFGDLDLSKLGTQLVTFARAMVRYSQIISGGYGGSAFDSNAVMASENAVNTIIAMSQSIDPTGGFIAWLMGEKDLGAFASNLTAFGEALVSYGQKCTMLSVVSINDTSACIENLVDALNLVGNINFEALNMLSEALNTFTPNSSFVDMFASAAESMSTVGSQMIQAFNTGITENAPSVAENAQTLVNNFVASVTTAISSNTLLIAASIDTLCLTLNTTIANKQADFNTSVTNLLTGVVSTIHEQYNNWYTAGNFLAIVLAAGIRSGESEAINAAAEVAGKALEAAKQKLQINSPSKVMYGFGRYFDLGFANGILDYADTVAKASENIATEAISTAQIIAENIAATMDEDFEYEPTIRPVLDMDEVDSGLNAFDRSFANRSMNLAGSIDRVRKAAPADKYAENVNPSQNQNGGATTYNFNQYNYSPKALSRIDLYRQTNNQFAMMKERGKA